jgi:Family of unknown function (DUF6508)
LRVESAVHATIPVVNDRLRRLAAHLPAFESPDFSFGEWVQPWTDAEGRTHMPWYRVSPAADAFLRDAGELVQPFDWPAWLRTPEGDRLRDPAAVAAASQADLGRLLTAILRSDRFTEGSLAGAFESGLLTAILRRAKELSGNPPG